MRVTINTFLMCGLLLLNFLFVIPTAIAEEVPIHYNFNSMPAHQLTDKISMRFITSVKFSVIQWNLKAGAKLFPPHSHPNEQVVRVLKGSVGVHSGKNKYTLHAGDVMVFPSNVPHGFIAITDAVVYEQQTPIRQDFLQPGFIEKLSHFLKKYQ